METNRLRQFNTLYQTGNMRKSAELLGISHSGLSKSISVLQQELDETLIIQSGRGIAFTDKGEELAKRIPDLLQKLDEVLAFQNLSTLKDLKIGSFEVFTTYFMNEIAGEVIDRNLILRELIPGKMEKALMDKEIDLAITYEPVALAGTEHLKIKDFEMSAYVRRGSFKKSNIQDIPFAAPLAPVVGAPTGIKGLDSWPDHLFKRIIKYQVDLMESALSLARNGHCAVFLPEFIARLHNDVSHSDYQLVKKPLPEKMKKVKRSVFIVKRNSSEEDQIVKKIAKILRRVCTVS